MKRNSLGQQTLYILCGLIVFYLLGFIVLRMKWGLGMFRIGKSGVSTVHRIHRKPKQMVAYYAYYPLFKLETLVSGRPVIVLKENQKP